MQWPEWPSKSPHLNPIEHVWDAMGHRMQGKRASNLDYLWQLLLQIQNELSTFGGQCRIEFVRIFGHFCYFIQEMGLKRS